VTAANLVIDRKTINCDPLAIRARNVRITNSRIDGEVWIDSSPSSYSFTISDSEVMARPYVVGGNDGATGIGKGNFVAIRDNVHGGIRPIWCEFNCTEQDNWLHGQLNDRSDPVHESATRAGENSVITHNTLFCEARTYPPPHGGGCSADLTGYPDFQVVGPWTISNNLFLATEGGTCAYGGATPNKPYSGREHDIVFQNNVFQKNAGSQHGRSCGYWFSIADFNRSAPGDHWINNRWDNGRIMPSDG
jgi:hypothetical protein